MRRGLRAAGRPALKFRHSCADNRTQTARSDCRPAGPRRRKPKFLEPQNQPTPGLVQDVREVRRNPRFKLAVEITVHSESCGMLKGRSIDISEIGIGVVLGEDIPVGESVKLHIPLPSGPVTISAIVRQRSSFFRHGFEFMQSNSVREILQSACRRLAAEQTASCRL